MPLEERNAWDVGKDGDPEQGVESQQEIDWCERKQTQNTMERHLISCISAHRWGRGDIQGSFCGGPLGCLAAMLGDLSCKHAASILAFAGLDPQCLVL